MEQEPKHKVSKWLWITLIIVIVMAAMFFIWYFLSGPGKKVVVTTPTATDTTTEQTPATATTPTISTNTAPTPSGTTPTTTASTPSSTTDWKTYTSDADSFSVKYPTTWALTESKGSDSDTVVFALASGSKWLFEVEVTLEDKTLQEAADAAKATLTSGGYDVTASNITVAGQPAIKHVYNATDAGGVDVYVINNSKLYTIHENTSADVTADVTAAFNSFSFIE